MHCSAFSSKQEPVIDSSNLCEECALLLHNRDESTLVVKDEHSTICAKDQHEASQVRDNTLLDLLLDVNPFLKLEGPLSELPDLDARLLNGEEGHRIGQVDLGKLTVTICLNHANTSRSLVVQWIRQRCLILVAC